jgi:uncharacterized protein (TIGR03083 family)
VTDAPTVQDLLAVLRSSHDRLAAALEGLSEEELTGPSYDDEWTIAQVASHLGSGAEIQQLQLDAGLAGQAAAGIEAIQPIWDDWNAKSPGDQVRDAIATDAAYLSRVATLTDDERASWHLELWGFDQDLAMFLLGRLNEHALHTWDVVVALDPSVTVAPDAVEYVVDNLGLVAEFTGRKQDRKVSLEVRTTAPERAYHLDIGPDGVRISPSYDDTTAAAELTLPADAFVRLVFGRLDPAHTPDSVQVSGIDLDDLRATFPGV